MQQLGQRIQDLKKINVDSTWQVMLLALLLNDFLFARGYHHISSSFLGTFFTSAICFAGLYAVRVVFKRRSIKITRRDIFLFLEIFIVFAIELPYYLFVVKLPW